jgi:Ca2+-binding RTX toxin-like protein
MGTNWVFVDCRVDDRAALLAGLGVDSEWRLVGPDEDGLRQIRAALDGQRDVASIRIVAHGRPGAILLGSTEIDGDTLARRDGELARIGQALAVGGDLQLYACAVGDGEVGRAFVDALAEGLGVPVAAASTPVGHADLGGDWRLDVGRATSPAFRVLDWRGRLGMSITLTPYHPTRSASEWRNYEAFAALKIDGSVLTWGRASSGGDSSAVALQLAGTIDVTQVFSTGFAFAALREDGSVVTWGSWGGDSSAVAGEIDGTIDVTRVSSTATAFAALRADGSVVTWGASWWGGDSGAVAESLNGAIDVTQVFSTGTAFAALRADGSVVTWGDAVHGGDSSLVASALDGTIDTLDVTRIFSNHEAFAALRADGSLVTWGHPFEGGAPPAELSNRLDGTVDVVYVAASDYAFAALLDDGSVVSWGNGVFGANSAAVAADLVDVTQVFATHGAFAALRADGSVVTWGLDHAGGDSSLVATALDGSIDVVEVVPSDNAFAALRADGSVVSWGHEWNISGQFVFGAIVADGSIPVTQIFSTRNAFAALRADGSIVTWGRSSDGGDSSRVASDLDGTIDVTRVFSTASAFAALRADGSVVVWGWPFSGGDANMDHSGVSPAGRPLNDVVSMADPFALDVYSPTGGNTLTGSRGNDHLNGGGANDVLDGSDGNDTLAGDSGNDILLGGLGDDLLSGGAGADSMVGGDGSDFYDVDDAGDSVSETNADPASGGIDQVLTYLAAYTLGTHVENGRILATGAANLTGNNLDNRLETGIGNNLLDGAGGNDTVSYLYGASSGVSVSLAIVGAQATGGSGSDTLIAIENLGGSNHDDSLTGDGNGNRLSGAQGNDLLNGGAGNDTLDGGTGNDRLWGGTGADSLTGGDGSDQYYVDHAGDSVTETNANPATGGTDQVFSSLAAYTLGANVENGRILVAGIASLTGNDLDNLLYGGSGNNLLDGAGGNDTASYLYGVSNGVSVSLAIAGPQATGGSGSDTLVGIENLSGSIHADTLTGDGNANRLEGASGNDTLAGGAGDDTLDGGLGADSLIGGDGSDQYYVDHAGDSVTETNANPVSGGTDWVFSGLTAYTLATHIENGRILATGAANLTGNALDNLLDAGTGNNLLDGAGGNDTVSYLYAVSGSGVSVSLALAGAQATGGSGSDTLAGIENLSGSAYDDTLTGDAKANRLSGAQGNDFLNGGAGNDTLDGGAGNDRLWGGSGADSLIGGDGSDFYYLDDAGDSVSETNANPATGGTDQVLSYLASTTLGAHIENGRILATGVANLTGNALDNLLDAGTGANLLDGAGGNDTVSYLYGASSGVSASLAILGAQATGGSGSDTLAGIENLSGSTYDDTLTGDGNANRLNGAQGNDFLNGNAGNDSLDGGAGNDTLWGGTGADSLTGGDGSDLYYVDHAGDSVGESNANPATGGIDQVFSYLAAYTLGANVENGRILATGAASLSGNALVNLLYAGVGNNLLDGAGGNDTVSYLYGVSGSGVTASLATGTATGGSGSDTLVAIKHLVGSAYADTLSGDGGANVLSGGNGNDTLSGGLGADTFRFDTLPNAATNRDTISDFNVLDDTIEIENAIFTSLPNGPLAATSFRSGAGLTTAADADDCLLYDSSSGALYYDAAGNGGAGPVQIGTLGSGLTLSHLDFVIT